MNSKTTRPVDATIDYFKFKNLERMESEEPLEGDEEVKLEPEETIPEIVKLNPGKNEGRELKILTRRKLLTRIPIY